MLQSTNETSIAIIGGGPAGLSLARFLSSVQELNVTVFEAAPQVGGKSWTFQHDDVTCEMGTCYATRADTFVRAWFKELGLETSKLGASTVDGVEYFRWAKMGPGGPLPLEVIRYLLASRRLNRKLAQDPTDAKALEEASMPIVEWLRKKRLPRMERLHYRAVTNMGYGRLDETPTVQAINWVDLALISSGRLNDFLMPTIGWGNFWSRLAEKHLNVLTSMRITRVERHTNGVSLWAGDRRFEFDKVVCAIPVDDFTAMTESETENEAFINGSISWNAYSTTLMAVKNWFTEESVRSFENGILLEANEGRLMSARHEAYSEELGGPLYVLNQLCGPYSKDELIEIAESDIRDDGGTPVRAILTKRWKYFAQYSEQSVRDGLLNRLKRMQGESNTYYTGATFSHEAVSKITRFNRALAQRITNEHAVARIRL